LFDKYNHLLIDEYQDLNIIERAVIQRVFCCNKTFVGDLNQKLFLQNYDDVYNNFKIVELKNSYRSTIEIFEFLETIIKSNGVNGVKRNGKEVEFKLFSNEDEEKKYLRDLIKNYDGKSLAIICKNKKQASKLYLELSDFDNVSFLDVKNKEIRRGVVVSGVSLVKGLEFDKVIVYGANDKNYNSEIDKNYFYIACSRAINELVVLSENDFTSFVDDKYRKNLKQ
jgi:DNA helicase-2/ATP-dependent DNA helicase PcrA